MLEPDRHRNVWSLSYFKPTRGWERAVDVFNHRTGRQFSKMFAHVGTRFWVSSNHISNERHRGSGGDLCFPIFDWNELSEADRWAGGAKPGNGLLCGLMANVGNGGWKEEENWAKKWWLIGKHFQLLDPSATAWSGRSSSGVCSFDLIQAPAWLIFVWAANWCWTSL